MAASTTLNLTRRNSPRCSGAPRVRRAWPKGGRGLVQTRPLLGSRRNPAHFPTPPGTGKLDQRGEEDWSNSPSPGVAPEPLSQPTRFGAESRPPKTLAISHICTGYNAEGIARPREHGKARPRSPWEQGPLCAKFHNKMASWRYSSGSGPCHGFAAGDPSIVDTETCLVPFTRQGPFSVARSLQGKPWQAGWIRLGPLPL